MVEASITLESEVVSIATEKACLMRASFGFSSANISCLVASNVRTRCSSFSTESCFNSEAAEMTSWMRGKTFLESKSEVIFSEMDNADISCAAAALPDKRVISAELVQVGS